MLRWGCGWRRLSTRSCASRGIPTWYNQDGGSAPASRSARTSTQIRPTSANSAWPCSRAFSPMTGSESSSGSTIGLRVATLVNLSFLGGDRADEAAARFVGHQWPHARDPTASAALALGRRCSFRFTSRAEPSGQGLDRGQTLRAAARPCPTRQGAGLRYPPQAPRSPQPPSRPLKERARLGQRGRARRRAARTCAAA